jgi:hypothetical protein
MILSIERAVVASVLVAVAAAVPSSGEMMTALIHQLISMPPPTPLRKLA